MATTKRLSVCFTAVLTMVFLAASAHAIPVYINYQGILKDGTGNPVTTSVDITFRIYDTSDQCTPTPCPGNMLWDEVQSITPVDGIYSVQLGKVDPLTPLDFDIPYWLTVEVGNDGEMNPRMPLNTAPFSVTSAHAESVDWVDINNIPTDIADGDSDTTYTPGVGIDITAGVITNTGDLDGADDLTTTSNFGGDVTGSWTNMQIGANTVGSAEIDPSQVQTRITGSCPVGQSISSIDTAGNVTCETDDVGTGDITEVVAGSGLNGGGSSGVVTLNGAQVSSDTSLNTTYLTATCQNHVNSAVTITTTGPGTILVSANTTVQLFHDNGVADTLVLGLDTTTTICGPVPERVYWNIPAILPSFTLLKQTLHVQRFFTVSSAGTYTYYLNGYMHDGYVANTDRFYLANMQALYIPSQ